MYVAAAGVVAFLLLAAAGAVCACHLHDEPASAPARLPAHVPSRLQLAFQQPAHEPADVAELEQRAAAFADAVRKGGGTVVRVSAGSHYCYGYTDPDRSPTCASPVSGAWRLLRETALGCCGEPDNTAGGTSLLRRCWSWLSCAGLRRLLRTPPWSKALLGAKAAWFLVSLFLSVLTLVTLAKETQKNVYRVADTWMLYWAMVQGWLAWVGTLFVTTSSGLQGVLDPTAAAKEGLAVTVFIAVSPLYAFGMLSVITTSCNAPTVLARAIDLLALLQTVLLPALLLCAWLKHGLFRLGNFIPFLVCTCECCCFKCNTPTLCFGPCSPHMTLSLADLFSITVLEPTAAFNIIRFRDEAGLLRRGYVRASSSLSLPPGPGAGLLAASAPCCGCFGSSSSTPEVGLYTARNCCSCKSTVRCYSETLSAMSWRCG